MGEAGESRFGAGKPYLAGNQSSPRQLALIPNFYPRNVAGFSPAAGQGEAQALRFSPASHQPPKGPLGSSEMFLARPRTYLCCWRFRKEGKGNDFGSFSVRHRGAASAGGGQEPLKSTQQPLAGAKGQEKGKKKTTPVESNGNLGSWRGLPGLERSQGAEVNTLVSI